MTSEPLALALSVANSRRAWLGAREVMVDDWVSYEIEAMTESRSATGSSGPVPRAEALASGQAPSQQCAGQPGGATGGRKGAQSHLG
eukprot:scaffold4683_cov107-Isochrysis_galbana.AAC.2